MSIKLTKEMKIYKYFNFSNAMRDLPLILNNKSYLTNTHSFNDPYDSRLRWSSELDKKIFDVVIDMSCEKTKECEYVDRKTSKYLYLSTFGIEDKKDKYPFFTELLYEYLREPDTDFNYTLNFLKSKIPDCPELYTFLHHFECVGISCFSLNGYDPQMWAHYANNYNGYCVEFEIQDLKIDEFTSFQVIDYVNEFPDPIFLNRSAVPRDKVIEQICTKSNAWEKESEVRIVSLASNNGKFLDSWNLS